MGEPVRWDVLTLSAPLTSRAACVNHVAMIFRHPFLLAAAAILLPLQPLRSEVTKVEITERRDIADTDYEEISGRLHFAVDPAHPGNRGIVDLDLAPVEADGRVAFSSDFRLLRPVEGAPAPVAAWMEIPNRGSRSAMGKFMIAHRFAMLEVGWEFDVPTDSDKLRIQVPVAREKDGAPVRGLVEAIFIVDEPHDTFTVTDLAEYLPVDPAGPGTRLAVREKGQLPGGRGIPRESWTLEKNTLTLEGGFEPGRTYEISWLAENPPVAGLGFAAIRDAAAWLKHDPDSLAPVPHLYAFGASQCGRYLRDFVYRGFNTDTSERIALDGIIPHIAGAGRLDLNRRWSTPRELALYRAASYPFADTAQRDPVSGLNEGLLENPRVTHRPRVFYTNTAAEYWGAGRVAALAHTDPEGKRDLTLPDDVRLYVFAGTQHGPSAFPPTSPGAGAPFANPVDFRPALLALRLAMHRWVSEGIAPPPSAYPRLSDGTLVPAAEVAFPAIPGVGSPRGLQAGLRMANPLYPDGGGAGQALPLLVPQVDADGNDLAGIRLPEIAVPLATATGWMFRPAEMGAPDELLPVLRGSWIPFPMTKADRETTGDPRRSREERYDDAADFLGQTRAAAEALVKSGYLLPEDVDEAVEKARERWDW
jgi:hypothetical protein